MMGTHRELDKTSDRKSVRFQDLSFIQESEEDQAEDTSAGVEGLSRHVPSPNQVGGDHTSTASTALDSKTPAAAGKNNKVRDGQRSTKPQSDPRRPPACPFGDRIAQERAEKTKQQHHHDNHNNRQACESRTGNNKNKEDGGDPSQEELPFPRNVIRLHEKEKHKSAKQKNKTAGVNPQAGKEKGSSFIITRNYLYTVIDNSTVLQPRNVYGQTTPRDIDADVDTLDTQQQHQQQPAQAIADSVPYIAPAESRSRVVVENASPSLQQQQEQEPPCDINSVSVGIPCSSSNSIQRHQQHASLQYRPDLEFVNNENNLSGCHSPVQHQKLYKPDSSLTEFINPFTAPNDQFYGSAAYGLKHTPQDTLSKPDVLKSSCVNQYLHGSSPNQTAHCYYTSVKEPRPLSVCASGTPQVIDTTIASTDKEQTVEKDNKNPAPNCQFLRDNFAATDNSHCTSINLTSSSYKPEEHNHQQQHHHQYQQQETANNTYIPSSSPGVIGPVYLSPRKQVLPSSSIPGVISDSQNQRSSPSPTRTIPTTATSITQASAAPASNTPEVPALSPAPATHNTPTTTMNYMGNTADIYGRPVPLSRFQEKEELQKLNDRFTSYVTRVRQLGQSVNNVDTSAFLRSTKVLEDEIVSLKTLYESELASLRQEIEAGSHERNSLHVQCTKHQKYAGEVQDRLAIESDKNSKLLDEVNVLQRKIGNLEAEVHDARIASQRPKEEIDHLHRTVENMTRESDQWKHRYDHEQVTRQEMEDRLQQLMKKVEFNDQVHAQQINDYQVRLDTSAATILSLEGKVRELSTADVSVAEMLKQVRETAETELKKYQIESEEQYSRNLSALKAQIDNDADSLSRYQTEKSQLMGNIGELQARIRNLEGQVQNMQHQKQSLEDAISVERNRSADNIQQLEKKLREMQDTVVVKMREITNAREANIPLKAEIETLKALMEEEERRLRVPLGIVPASVVQTTLPATPSTQDILASSVTNQVLKPRTPPNSIGALSAQPTSIGFVTSTSSALNQQQQLIPSSSGCLTSAGTVNLTEAAKSVSIAPLPARPCLQTTAPQQQQLIVSNLDSIAQGTVTSSSAAQVSSQQEQQQQLTSAGSTLVSATYSYPPCAPPGSGIANPLYPYVPSPPLDTMYIPDALQTLDTDGTLAYDPGFGSGDGMVGFYDSYTPAFNLPMCGPRYQYEAHPSINRLHVEPSPPISPKQAGGNNLRAKSAPATKPCHNSLATQISEAREKNNLNLVPSDMGNGRDYFEEMFNDLQRDTLFSKARPKSSPLERPVPSTYHDYTVSTSSAIGDLKILEVNQDGKFVRLVNDGPTEFEFGGYMVQQNVGGHPVAVFRFPPRTKFPPDSTITVWSAMNDSHLHNPPTDFFWKEQQKWGTGPECTTILCRANGQAVAWTTAAHRFTKDAFIENKTDGDDSNKFDYNKDRNDDDNDDDEALKELTIDANAPRPEPVYLRREKQQPPTLTAPRHPHGACPANGSHPHTGQARPLFYGNDNSSVNRQSRTQTTRPDPIPGQPYAGAPAQRVGSAPLRKMTNQGTIRTGAANRSTLEPGETSESPSPFMRPHSRFESGLEQVQSQHHPNFLPPMPRPPQASC